MYSSDSDDDTDSSGYYDSEFNQLKQIDYKDEFEDADLEELVKFRRVAKNVATDATRAR